MNKPFTIEARTPLLPELVAERCLAETKLDVAIWTKYLTTRADFHFRHSLEFHKKMMGARCREWLEAFMRHWIAGGEGSRIRWEYKHTKGNR